MKWRRIASILAGAASCCLPTRGVDGDFSFFESRIRPVLVRECYPCHSVESGKSKGELRVDTRDSIRKGGEGGPAVVPSEPAKSRLMQALRHQEGLEMPPKKPALSPDITADFERWIAAGAPDPRVTPESATPSPADSGAREFWSFKPVSRPSVPTTRSPEWEVRTPVDAFVLERLLKSNLSPAETATPAELIRRLTFDLTGLPPTPEEVDAFVKDPSGAAWQAAIDRLLESPRFGERWAQHWLDVVRYAESEGFEYDRQLPGAWRYRDYVVDAFQRDKPFDQFLTEQVAGDELEPGDSVGSRAAILHRLGPVRRNAGNPEIALSRNEILTERTDVIGAAFLGLTLGCARCHDHKLDPISQRDYYRFEAYFAGTQENDIVLAGESERKSWEAATKRITDEAGRLKKSLEGTKGDDRARLMKEIEAVEATLPAPLPTVPSVRNDAAQRTEIHVLKRGEWERKGNVVGPRPPTVLVEDSQSELPGDSPNPRRELAAWMTHPGNPLTARVIVNRIWQYHFGAGLVRTPNDFGHNGDRPSHPELLDWLASELVRNGWRLKPIHRLILASSTYRQSSHSSIAARAAVVDPDDRLLWRFRQRRLSAEEIRDSMLAASGRLNLRLGGPGVMLPVDPQLIQLLYKPSQWEVTADVNEHTCRSIYLVAKRNLRLPFFETFDQPASLASCGRRESSTHAPQALELLNGRISNELARAFAERLERECPGNTRRQVERAFRLALGRAPTPAERALADAFLPDQPLSEFTLALFNLNDFLYVP